MNLFPRPASQSALRPTFQLTLHSAGARALKELPLARFLLSGILMNLGLVMLQEWNGACEPEFTESPKVRNNANTAILVRVLLVAVFLQVCWLRSAQV